MNFRRRMSKTILHELIHHLTSDTIGKYLTVYYDGNGVNIRYNDNVDINSIPSEIIKIKMIWEEAYKKLSSEYNLINDAVIDIMNNDNPNNAGYSDEARRMAYAMHDVNEMFVSMFFDKTFQDKMAEVEYKNSGESLFRKFASAVFRLFKKLFGGARTDTLAASMFESFCELIQNNVQTELFRPVKLEAYDISSDPEINEDFILNKIC